MDTVIASGLSLMFIAGSFAMEDAVMIIGLLSVGLVLAAVAYRLHQANETRAID